MSPPLAIAEPVQSTRRRITALDVAAFTLPALLFLEITIIGRLIVTEILLLAALPWLWRAPDRPPLPRWFVVLWAGWLVSQIATDLVVGSAFRDYARGWAGILVTFTNFAAVLVLVATPRRARLFALGLGVGGLLGLLFAPHPSAAVDPWKWALAMPVGFLLAAGLSGRIGDNLRWLTVAVFAAFGVMNLMLGYRSLGGISLLVAGYLCLSAFLGSRSTPADHPTRRAAVALVFLGAAGLAVLGLYSASASQGILGLQAQATYFAQGGALGALLGGRPEALVSTEAILDSPVLGHGSWAKDSMYAKLLAERQRSLGYEVTPIYVGAELIPAHSYLMGAWVWAGFLGALFWFAVGAVAVWLLSNLYRFRVELAPLLVFSTILLLWDIAFSPYGLRARILAPYGLALCLLGLRLLRDKQHAAPPPHRTRQSWRHRGPMRFAWGGDPPGPIQRPSGVGPTAEGL